MRGVVLVLLAAVCFGSTGTAVALGAPHASPLSVGAVRVVLGGALLSLVAVATAAGSRRRRPLHPGLHPAQHPGSSAGPVRIVETAQTARTVMAIAAATLGVVAYQPLFFTGTTANGVAVGTVVALGAAPLITGLLGWLLTAARPGRRWSLATAIAVAGLVLLVVGGGPGAGVHPAGIIASAGAGASYAAYTVAAESLLRSGWHPATSAGAVFGAAAVLSLPLLITTDLSWLSGPGAPAAWASVLWLGAVATALAYALLVRGLSHLPAATVASLSLAEPLTATVLGLTVLDERLGAVEVAALALLATGLVALAVPVLRRPDRTGPAVASEIRSA